MKFIHSLLGNSFLMFILFAMLFLPIGVMGLSSMQQGGNEVLSQTSAREKIQLDLEQVDETTDSTDPRQQVDYR